MAIAVISMHGDPGCRATSSTKERRLSHEIRRKLVANAREALKAWDIPWQKYCPGSVTMDEHGVTASVSWTHRRTKAEIVLSQIYFNRQTGEIRQAGTNYGALVF